MIEQVYEISGGDERIIEKTIQDENIHFIHMVFHQNEGLPKHVTDSTVYLTVLRGTVSIDLGRQKGHEYVSGCILKIPRGVKMKADNIYEDVLELLVVKAPAPKE